MPLNDTIAVVQPSQGRLRPLNDSHRVVERRQCRALVHHENENAHEIENAHEGENENARAR